MVSEALKIPILPHTSPQADQPSGMRLPLHPHQLRALHRCLVIEGDGSLGRDFGHFYDFRSRGGVLADAVGTGKTATMIGLVLESASSSSDGNGKYNDGDTLVVAPDHLIPQWKREIEKMAKPEAVEIVVGKKEYERRCSVPPMPAGKARIVLVDVDTILNEQKLWYDWRKVYSVDKDGNKRLLRNVALSKMELYRRAAQFSVKSPKGPVSYEGWLYTGPLHLCQRPWRRVVFDEIQDLVAAGKESQKNLLQLTRTAENVWLLSATPFPHGNSSVYANHELLGFCRLKIDVTGNNSFSSLDTFERIKRRLYIRSPRHVANEAVTVPVKRDTVFVQPLALEKQFYRLESEKIEEENPGRESAIESPFDSRFNPLREMAVHPEASEGLREQLLTGAARTQALPVSASVDAAARRAVADANERLRLLEATNTVQAHRELEDTLKSVELAKKIKTHRDSATLTANPFAGPVNQSIVEEEAWEKEAAIIHSHYCLCSAGIGSPECYADRHVRFRVVRPEGAFGPEYLQGQNSLQKVVRYFREDLRPGATVGWFEALNSYIIVTQRTYEMRKHALAQTEQTKRQLKTRIESLSRASHGKVKQEKIDDLARRHGSKPAALVRFLRKVADRGEKAIVFSFWHDTLKLVRRTLIKCQVDCVFCRGSGSQMSKALESFTNGTVPVLLLSGKSKASGANLQCARHVILLDPAGSSSDHGMTLEAQAIGRAVRMGQEKPVTVTRFCVVGTIEEGLFQEIDAAAARENSRSKRDTSYVIQDAEKTLPSQKKNEPAPMKEEGNGIQVTEAITGEERVRRDFLQAKEKGYVVNLVDDEDKGEPPEAAADRDSAERSYAVVKQERVSQQTTHCKRGSDEMLDGAKSPEPKQPRTDERTPNTVSQTRDEENPHSWNAIVTPKGTEGGEGGDHSNAEKKMRIQKLRDLLGRLELTQYEEKLISCGYDCVEWLTHSSKDAALMEKVSEDVGFKPGHAVRFQIGLTEEREFPEEIVSL